jgi:hypothetical protein
MILGRHGRKWLAALMAARDWARPFDDEDPSDTGRRRALRHRPGGVDAAPARMADGSPVTDDGGRGESAADVRP